ncbi:MAG: ATP-binding cassette domain-containing protein [Proteobacteria bacterium]|nr:ATP-binding cassette domain-containing protein [Pseudomonadota bacterium]
MTHARATATPDEDKQPLRPLLGRIWRDYVSRRWGRLLLAGLCAIGIAGVSAALTGILEPAVNAIKGGKASSDVYLIPLILIGLTLVRAALQMSQALLVNRIGHRVVGDVQMQVVSRLLNADLARLRSEHTGSYVSSVLFDANLIRQAFTDGIVNYLQNSLQVISQLAVMFWIDPLLAACALVAAPLVGMVIQRFAKQTRKAAQGAMAETSNLSTAMMESLDGVKIVKIENREAYEEARIGAVVDRRQGFVIKGANAKALATPATEAVTMVTVAGVLAFAIWRAQVAHLTVGGFAAFLVAMLLASQSLRQVANLQSVFAEGLAAARRLFVALDIEPEIRESDQLKALPPAPCRIDFEHVAFAYHEGASALADVSLSAKPGETIALVGPSGGGKSTILNLIPRFYDAGSGRVTLNGVDIRDASLADLRSKIALVTQEPFLFDDTIGANIAYARPDASQAEIEAAAEAAAAHEFIAALPQGYQTTVGEAGARLSGGQRQRIAIARAFLKDAPILLLDEATSALDTESEAKVQVALERLMHGRTTLLIAHRLSTVRGADRIYVIEAGKVVEQGTHAQLVKAGGLYARLAKSQDLETAAAP